MVISIFCCKLTLRTVKSIGIAKELVVYTRLYHRMIIEDRIIRV